MTGNSPEPEPQPSQLDRALPAWAVDLLVFGLSDTKAVDPRQIWTAFLSVAMSAYARGWSQTEFRTEATKFERRSTGHKKRKWTQHRLWIQLCDHNTEAAAFRALGKAWDAAVVNINDVGVRTKQDIRDDALERALLWVDRITDGYDELTDDESRVMGYVISETQRRGMLRVTCPSRDAAEFAKVSTMTAHRILKRLSENDLLVQHSRGRKGKSGDGRAAIYGLSDPESTPLAVMTTRSK